MIGHTRFYISFRSLSLVLLVFLGPLLASSFEQVEVETNDATQVDQKSFSPTKEQARTTRALVEMLEHFHYLDERIDDAFSERVFNNFLRILDPNKIYFLAADIEEFAPYRHSFDEELKKGKLESAFNIYNRYYLRRQQRLDYTLECMNEGIASLDFNKTEYLELDRKNLSWHDDMSAAKDLWRRLLKDEILYMKLDDTPEDEILSAIRKRHQNQSRVLEQIRSDDIFEGFITAYTHSYDPHTDYLPPDESEGLDIRMSLSLEGIGALLQREDQYIKVVRLVPGGPAERGKELQPADRIVAVGQGEEGEMQDVEGWRLDDAVKLIRGPKDTVVRLRIIPADSTDISQTKIVSITRDTVKLEEQSAKKSIIEVKRGERLYKIGVIDLPTFYVDYEAAFSYDRDYRSSTRDVEKLILELLNEEIAGLVIDLRDNGGGSLQEANEMTGLFIRTGPVVQIRNAGDRIELFSDYDPKFVYKGPLAVLVNRLSASASEILAGAIQDYGRGIVIGSQTFGKGTVQGVNDLKPGRVKYTQSKYYRISGDSTQERGVIPDIVVPSELDHDKIGESSLPQAMAWDQIKPVHYRRLANLGSTINYLKKLHKQRISKNADFIYLNEYVKFLEENRGKTRRSLNESERREERESIKRHLLAMENRRRQSLGMELYEDYSELESAEEEEDSNLWHESILQEAGDILVDWITADQKMVLVR